MEGISNSSMAAVPSFLHHDCRFPAFANSFNPKPVPIGKRFLSHKSRLAAPFPVKPLSTFSRRAVAISLTEASTAVKKLGLLVLEFQSFIDPQDRLKRLLRYAESLPPFDETLKTADARVPSCTSQVWLRVELSADRKLRLSADSDSEVTKGFCGCLVRFLDGATPEEVLSVKTEDLEGLNNAAGLNGRKANTWHNILMTIQKRTKALMAEAEGLPWIQPFPSLIVSADRIQAKGSYAEAQARFLLPDESKMAELVKLLREKKIGIVAHFYMDPEVQGVLTAAQKSWPHIHISDSLVMADSAVKMAKSGCEFIAVLGVDFMSENVRAVLDNAGFPEVSVYRMSDERIGCSLADAAASAAYMDYLSTAAASVYSPSLHVVYINTSLESKAFANEVLPTITCTSSNVVQTILQAFAEIPDLHVWYGPDTYMGANITELLTQMTLMGDEEISEIHPKHDRNSIKSLIPRFHYFEDGTCIVHQLFGHEVVAKIRELYCDAFLTAHFEVPGEMFSLATEAKRRGTGVVGSTQNILDFIKGRVKEALDRKVENHLQFVLGTESGMVTSIVAAVSHLLRSADSEDRRKGSEVTVEIVFPVSSESITRTPPSGDDSVKFRVVPGVAGGEGCSIHGGCASCPYMKMNSLDSLLKVCGSLPDGGLSAFSARRMKTDNTPNGNPIADVGCEPILYMRHFQANGKLPEDLIRRIGSLTRT